MVKIKRINNYHTDENTYLVYDEKSKNGIVIDPGYQADGILKSAGDEQVTIQYIFLTHCHYDHIEFANELKERTGAKIVTGVRGKINCADPDINLTVPGLGRELLVHADLVLKDQEQFEFDSLKIKCIETPGHTNCSVCFLCGDHLFCGDTLFLRNVGRWDLPTGCEDELIQSIRTKLYCLDGETTVHPGHGEATSIAYEKKYNMYVKG